MLKMNARNSLTRLKKGDSGWIIKNLDRQKLLKQRIEKDS